MAHSPNETPKGPGNVIETRPLHVEEWLDSLPYADFLRTARLIEEASRATNTLPVKAAARLELVEVYDRPYQYYVESQIRAGAQHTLQSIETMQGQIGLMKQIAVNLALACRLSADELLKQKTSWRQTKPPLPALMASLHYLSHAMIFGFLEYAPIPKNVWRQLHSIYEFAESIQRELETVQLPGRQKGMASTIADTYKRIALAALVDPHRLPFGAIWEVYEQLRHWTGHVQLRPFEPISASGGCFIIDLDSDSRPLTPDKQNEISAVKRARIMDCAALGGVVEDQVDRLDAGLPLTTESRLSPYFARVVLGQMLRAWGVPPQRNFAREPRSGVVGLVRGMAAVFFNLNGRKEFDPGRDPDAEDDGAWQAPAKPGATPVYQAEQWNLVDQGMGGFAVITADRPPQTVRVGDLVAFVSTISGKEEWTLGIIRWLMVRQAKSHRLGAQIIAGNISAIGVRATTGSLQDRRFRRALLLESGDSAKTAALITERGFHVKGRDLEMRIGDRLRPARAGALTEGSVAFERFELQ